MPQASSELRAKWGGKDGIGEDKADKFLREHGWTEEKFVWHRPQGVQESEISNDEWDALTFLVQEWDHGYQEWQD